MLALPRLRNDQARIAKHPARVKVLACGRRWGKTVLGGRCVMEVLSRHGRVAWIAPSYKNTRPLWRWAAAAVAPAVKQGRMRVNQSERTIDTDGGGFLAVYSGDNIDSIRGEAFHLAVLDEAAMLGETAWTDAIMPTLADYAGDAILISTPKGRNWFWQEFIRAQADGAHSMAFTAPSAANPLPNIQHAAELARERVSERTYRQEWLAEFVEDAGVFRHVREAATAQAQTSRTLGRQYVIGIDWGRTDDATVYTVLDVAGRSMVALERLTVLDYARQLARLRALIERFKPTTIVAEQNSMGGPLIEQLQREGLPVRGFTTTNATKADIIDALALAFENASIQILDDPVLLAELQAYEAEQLPSGLVRYSAPANLHDDCVISLALAWHAATAGGPRARVREY